MNCDMTLEDRLAGIVAEGFEQTGDQMRSDALAWVGDHKAEWEDILDLCGWYCKVSKRFSFRMVCDRVVWVNGVGMRHALTAPLYRLALEEIPEMEFYARCAKSKCDDAGD